MPDQQTQISPKQGDKQINPVPSVVQSQSSPAQPKAKEQEPAGLRAKENKIMAEIKAHEEVADAQMLKLLRESFSEITAANPKPELKADVEDAGVVSPQDAANKVITDGATLELPTDEATYKRGLHQKIIGKVIDKTIVGVSSVAAFALFITRLVKMAHKHTMRVIFRRPPVQKASGPEGV